MPLNDVEKIELIEMISKLADANRQVMATMLETPEDYEELRPVMRAIDDVQSGLERLLNAGESTAG